MGERLLTHRRWAIAATLALLAVVVAVLLVASGGGSGDDGESTPFAPVAEAAERTASAPGAEIRMDSVMEVPSLPEPLVMEGEGTLSGTRVHLEARAVSGPPGLNLEAGTLEEVVDGTTIYMRGPAYGELPDGAEWMSMDIGELQSDQTRSQMTQDPRQMLNQLETMEGVEELGTEAIDGVRTTHYSGTADPMVEVERLREEGEDERAEQLESILEASGGEGEHRVDVWVDERGMVRRMQFDLPMEYLEPGATASLTMTMSSFGPKPEIEVPDPDDVYDATELGINEAAALGD